MGAVQPGWGSFFPCGKRVHTGGHPSCAQVHAWMSARSRSNPTFAQPRFEPTTLDSPGKFPPYWAPTTQVFICCISHSFQQDSVILKLYSPSDDIMPLSAKSAGFEPTTSTQTLNHWQTSRSLTTTPRRRWLWNRSPIQLDAPAHSNLCIAYFLAYISDYSRTTKSFKSARFENQFCLVQKTLLIPKGN